MIISILSSKTKIIIRFFLKVLGSVGRGKNGKWNLLFTIGAIIITTGILGYLLFSQWNTLINYSWQIRPLFLGVAFLVYTIILGLTVFVWSRIIEKLGKKILFTKHFRSFCISALGKRLPGTLWYILWRTQIYGDDSSLKQVTLASAFEMAISIVSATIACLIFSIPLIIKYQWSIVGIAGLLLISIVVIHPRFINWVLKRLKVEANNISYSSLIQWIGLYIFIWALIGGMLFSIGNFFVSIPIANIGYFIGCVALVGVLSRLLLFSPSLFGFGEVSLSLLLSGILPSSIAVIIAIAYRIIVISFEIIWAIISILLEKTKQAQGYS